MTKLKRVVLCGVTAYLATLVMVGYAGSADAAYRMYHGSQCHGIYDNEGSGLYNGVYLRNSTGSGMYVACPALSDSSMGLNGADLALTVTEGTNGSNSKACRANPWGWSYSCGTASSWASGDSNVWPSTSAWSSDAIYGVIFNYVTNGSRIYGYYTDH